MLRPPKPRENKVPFGFRISKDLVDYYRGRAGKRRGALVETIESALRLQMELEELLAPELKRLEQFAAAEGISLDAEAAVIARAVTHALDSLDSRRRK